MFIISRWAETRGLQNHQITDGTNYRWNKLHSLSKIAMLAPRRSRVDSTQSKQPALSSAGRPRCRNTCSGERLSAGGDPRRAEADADSKYLHSDHQENKALSQPTHVVWLGIQSYIPGTTCRDKHRKLEIRALQHHFTYKCH